jgi:RHS repeat-associated protein
VTISGGGGSGATAGAAIAYNIQTLSWDAENRLAAVSCNGNTTSYVYDGDGNRIKKTVDGVSTVYVNQYYEVTGTEVTTNYYLGSKLIAVKKGEELSYIQQDHLGGTSGTSDTSGNSASTIRYLPFGLTRFSTGTLPTDKKFTGQLLDTTGLYYYNARYYDPSIGRFISADTIVQDPSNPQTLNRYSYCLNNPLKYIDPTGHGIDDLDSPSDDGQLGWSEGQWYISSGGKWITLDSGAADQLCEAYKDSTFTTWPAFMNSMGIGDISSLPRFWIWDDQPKYGYTQGDMYWSLVIKDGTITISGTVDLQVQADRFRRIADVLDLAGEGLTQSVPQEYLFSGLALGGIMDLPAAGCVLLFYYGCSKGGDWLRALADWEEQMWNG